MTEPTPMQSLPAAAVSRVSILRGQRQLSEDDELRKEYRRREKEREADYAGNEYNTVIDAGTRDDTPLLNETEETRPSNKRLQKSKTQQRVWYNGHPIPQRVKERVAYVGRNEYGRPYNSNKNNSRVARPKSGQQKNTRPKTKTRVRPSSAPLRRKASAVSESESDVAMGTGKARGAATGIRQSNRVKTTKSKNTNMFLEVSTTEVAVDPAKDNMSPKMRQLTFSGHEDSSLKPFPPSTISQTNSNANCVPMVPDQNASDMVVQKYLYETYVSIKREAEAEATAIMADRLERERE